MILIVVNENVNKDVMGLLLVGTGVMACGFFNCSGLYDRIVRQLTDGSSRWERDKCEPPLPPPKKTDPFQKDPFADFACHRSGFFDK
ncbi:MAG: hypothetical protein KKE37_07255 [Verrucomicrobia bacterium]|nr:hypothetical protein [Verrucomicrobiota bacterium]MBU4247009.1 hypothetical protein [Verrucomicrobiota bacterium]MBU4290341.1 hypothetical protein [Verrucomicrobiota bacterium]MBU4429134.1 hypothetical protein [Verrucomicrobiota bacterium]MCG2681760.1 hypothetical protein [Kiritimatiellia bacterium]